MRFGLLAALLWVMSVPVATVAQTSTGLPALREEVVAESAARQRSDDDLWKALAAVQARVEALEAKINACVNACEWKEVAFHPLDSLPPGAVVRHGGMGSAGFDAVYGRTAFYTTSDWGILWIPVSSSSAPAVALEAQFYIPSITTYQRLAELVAFTDLDSGPWQLARGVRSLFAAETGGTNHFDWFAYTAANGWGGGGAFDPPALRLPIHSTITAGWRTVRVEAARGLCRFRTRLEGAEILNWSAPCDATGAGVALSSWYQTPEGAYQPTQVAWSNLRVFHGSAGCAP